MPQAMMGRLSGLSRALGEMTLGQKLVAVIGVLVLVLGGFYFVTWVTKPTFAPLYTGLAGEDASAIVDQLTTNGVPYELTDGGSTIMVPKDAVYGERIEASAAGLPASAGSGYALLDNPSMTSSEFQQNVTWQRALEGELASTIEAIDGMQTAVVHLAIPEESVFSDGSAKPTASVLVRTKPGDTISGGQVESIVNLVASSVDGMDTSGVTVADANGKLLSSPDGTGTTAGDEAVSAYEAKTQSTLQAMLDQMLGAGNATVAVTAALDQDKVSTLSEIYSSDPATAPLQSSVSEETYTGTGGAGAAVGGGLLENGVIGEDTTVVNDTGTVAGGAGDGTYSKTDTSVVNGTNKVTEQRDSAGAPEVTKQSVAVVLNSNAPAVVAVDMADVTAAMTTAAGIDAARGDAITVNQVPFDASAAEAAAAELAAADAAASAAATNALIKQGVIAGAILLLLVLGFILWRRAAKRRGGDVQDIGRLELVEREALAMDAAAQAAARLAATPMPPQLAAPDPSVAQRNQVNDLVDQQPAEVAEILRGWLQDKKAS